MPKNVIITDAQDLASVPLPQHGGRYTAVGHKFIIDEVLNQLQSNGYQLKAETYTKNLNGEVALGVYHLNHGTDPDMGLMFAWSNSYDKSMRFRCAIGGHVLASGSSVIAGDMSNYGRKHMGDAKEQVKEHISDQIRGASSYFTALLSDKNRMKTIMLSDTQIAELMGILFYRDEYITSSQLINIKAEHKKASFDYNAAPNSLWTIYNHIVLALKSSHPKTWMEQQKNVHAIIKQRYFNMSSQPVVEEVDPNQLDLVTQAEELTVSTEPEMTGSLELDDYLTEVEEVSEEDTDLKPSEPCDTAKELLSAATHKTETDENKVDTNQTEPQREDDTFEGHNNDEEFEYPAPPADLPVAHGLGLEADQTRTEDNSNIGNGLTEIPESVPEPTFTEAPSMATSTEGAEQNNIPEEVISIEDPEELKSLEEQLMGVKPLDEQVAGEIPQPVSEEELAISTEPIVDQEEVVTTNFDFNEAEEDKGKTFQSPEFEF